MDISKIQLEVNKLNNKQFERFCLNTFHLFGQLASSVHLRGPYRLIPDSNILMRLESYRNGNITEGVLSIFLIFEFLKTIPHKYDLVILPTVFYEYVRKKKPGSLRSHWDAFRELKDIINGELSISAFFDGVETFQGAKSYFEVIEKDVHLISDELRSYQSRNWRFDFIRPYQEGFEGFVINDELVLIPPLLAARGLHKPIGLQYFDEEAIGRFLIDHIQKYLVECNENDRQVIEEYRDERNYPLTKVLKLTPKGNLTGVADIDLFSQCNVHTQFKAQAHGRYFPASIAITIDKALSDTLEIFGSMVASSGEIVCGEGNVEDSGAKIEIFMEEQNRMNEGARRYDQITAQQADFIDSISGILER